MRDDHSSHKFRETRPCERWACELKEAPFPVERFFSETGAGKHVPRCVMVDLEFGHRNSWGGSDGSYTPLAACCCFFVLLWCECVLTYYIHFQIFNPMRSDQLQVCLVTRFERRSYLLLLPASLTLDKWSTRDREFVSLVSGLWQNLRIRNK